MRSESFLVRGGLRVKGLEEGAVRRVREGRRRAVIPSTNTGRVREHGGFDIIIEPDAGMEDRCRRGVKF